MRRRPPPRIPWDALLAWYRANRREMPWRGSRDPYAVWLSETMLQQTRIGTVLGYYPRFLARFPGVRALAAAPLPAVLKAWEGLGYYSRARHLHAAAKRMAEAGRFPRSAAEWAELPGVGPYTAAAIASICLDEPAPVVDGNVARVAARLRAEPLDPRSPGTRGELAAWLRPAVERSGAPGDFNQALMELGETLCAPKAPRCAACPLRGACRAAAEGAPERYPARPSAREVPLRRFAVFVVRGPGGRVLMAHRPEKGLLGGLWELPMSPVARRPREAGARRALERAGLRADSLREVGAVSHAFSHFRQELHVWEAGGGAERESRPDRAFVRPARVAVATASVRALALAAPPRRPRLPGGGGV